MIQKLKIAVRDLVEHVLRSGDLEFDFTGSIRSLEAIRTHQKIQKSRPENYHPEVPVTHKVETDRFSIALIPHTLAITTLGDRQPGQAVNIEPDILGKYVAKFVKGMQSS